MFFKKISTAISYCLQSNSFDEVMIRLTNLPLGSISSGIYVDMGCTKRVSTRGVLFTDALTDCCAFLLVGKDLGGNPAVLLCHAFGGMVAVDRLEDAASSGKALNDELQAMSSISKAILISGLDCLSFQYTGEFFEKTLNTLLKRENADEKIHVEVFICEKTVMSGHFSLQPIPKNEAIYDFLRTSNVCVCLNGEHVDIKTYHDLHVPGSFRPSTRTIWYP